MIAPHKFKEDSTNHMLLDSVISYAKSEEHILLLKEWFVSGIITDTERNKIEGVTVSTKHKHNMVRRIYSSFQISLDEKEKMFEDLGEIDKSDWYEKTRAFCKAAHVSEDNKK